MDTSRSRGSLAAVGTAILVLLLLVGASPAAFAGQSSAEVDPRWLPWFGCWTADNGAGVRTSDWTRGSHMCVVPGSRASAVDIINIVDNRMASRDRIDADGTRQPYSEQGCTGWQRAEWAADGRRVFTRTEAECTDGRTVRSSAVFAFSSAGDWLDVMGVASGDTSAIRTLRYRAGSGLSPALPTSIAASMVAAAGAIGTARALASSAVTIDAVTDASRRADAPVVQAWLIERGQPFELDAKRLVAMADAGVPAAVIDLVVALTFPQEFTLGAARIARAAPERQFGGGGGGGGGLTECRLSGVMSWYGGVDCGWSMFDGPFLASSPFGFACVPSGRTGYDWLRCSGPMRAGYMYDSYGYGYGYPYSYSPWAYSTWYVGQDPFVITSGSGGGGTTTAPAHGRVVNGRGYTQGSSSDPVGSSAPASTPTPSMPSSAPSGSGGSDSPPASSPSPSSGGGERTAHPR
jgi:hypothetical protein